MERRYVKTTVVKPCDWFLQCGQWCFEADDEDHFNLRVWSGGKPNSARIVGYSLTVAGDGEYYYDAVHNGVPPTRFGEYIEEVEDLPDEQGRPCRDVILCDDFLDEMDRLIECDEIAFGLAMSMAQEWECEGGIEKENLDIEIDKWLIAHADEIETEVDPRSIVYFLYEEVPIDFFEHE